MLHLVPALAAGVLTPAVREAIDQHMATLRAELRAEMRLEMDLKLTSLRRELRPEEPPADRPFVPASQTNGRRLSPVRDAATSHFLWQNYAVAHRE